MNQAAARDAYSEVAEDQSQYLTFRLCGETYAVQIMRLREIIDFSELTNVPMMPDFIRGVLNLRGRVVPVIDLSVRFNSKSTEITKRTSIIIAEIADQGEILEIGVIVDGVNEVLDIPASEIEPPPNFGLSIRTDFIEGMGKVDGDFLILLDIDRVLSVEELSKVQMAIGEDASSTEVPAQE